jgi:hypothetical protein
MRLLSVGNLRSEFKISRNDYRAMRKFLSVLFTPASLYMQNAPGIGTPPCDCFGLGDVSFSFCCLTGVDNSTQNYN